MTPNPMTLPETLTVAEAIRFFADAKHRSYPVVDGEGRLIGLMSRSDALRWQMEEFAPLEATLAEVLSDSSLPFATPSDPISRIADLMVDSGIGRIPVVDHATGHLVGILSRQDMLKVRAVHRSSELARG